MKIKIDSRKSVPENARTYYEEAKKAERKVAGAKKALEETLKKIAALEGEKALLAENAEEKPEKKEIRERKWFDLFRDFTSSDGFFVVGGRDATTNEILIKKHTEKDDLVFHADIQGAPFFVIKNPEKKEIPEQTKKETAEMAASYSKAWAAGLGSCDVYYVMPEQVSKTPPAGEYLPKGAFMIYGKKEWFRGVRLAVAVGFVLGEEEDSVLAGPVSAVEKKTRHFAEVGPGEKKSKQLAEDIKAAVLKDAGKDAGQRIKKIPAGEIQKHIPAGKGRVRR